MGETVGSADDHATKAEEAKKRGQWVLAWRHAYASRHAAGNGSKLGQRMGRLQEEIVPHLNASDVACLHAWFGPDLDLQLRYARVMLENKRSTEALAQALAILDLAAEGKYLKEALEIAQKARPPGSYGTAPGARHSIYHVALLAPQSGDYEAYGKSLLAGLSLALDEFSARGPLAIRLNVYDTGGEGWRAVSQAHFAMDNWVGVLVGDVLTVPTTAIAGVANERALPLLSPSATDPLVGAAGSNVFQTGASAAEQATALARYATREKHFTAIAVPANLDSTFRAAFDAEAARGNAHVIALGAATGLRDMRAIAAELRKQRADALLLPGEPVLAELWVAGLVREKMLLPLLATEALDPQGFRADTRASLENMSVVSADYALAPAVFARVDSLARAGYGLEADRFVRRGYLTGRVITAALAAGADSPATLTAALRRRSGALGFVHYEESEATLPILSVRRGQLVRVK